MQSVPGTQFECRFLNLAKEAEEILTSNSIKISQTSKYKYEQSFLKYLELKRLLGNYMIPVGILASLVVGITVFLFLYLFEIEKYWMYILLITSGVILTLLIAAFGFKWKRASKSLKRREMQSWIAKRLFLWSKREVAKEQNCNKKRFLIENLLNLANKFVPIDSDSKEAESCGKIIGDVIDAPENLGALFLICILFKKVYKKSENKFVEKGKNVASRILLGILNNSKNEELRTEIINLLEEFWKDTNIDVRNSVMNIAFVDLEQNIVLEKSDIEKGELDKRVVDYEFFEDLWNLSDDLVLLFRKEFAFASSSDSPDLSINNNMLANINDESVPASLLSPMTEFVVEGKPINECLKQHALINGLTDRLKIVTEGSERASFRSKLAECSFNKNCSRIFEGKYFGSEESVKTLESMRALLKLDILSPSNMTQVLAKIQESGEDRILIDRN